MSTLQLIRPRVQPDWRDIARDWTPPEPPDECEPFISPEDTGPSPADEAWLVAFNAANSGRPADWPKDVPLRDRERVCMGHAAGNLAGRLSLEARAAREVGRVMGLAGSASEPPAGYAPHQAQAYREGYAEVVLAADEDAQFEVWVAHHECEALEDHFQVEITDRDVYPMGCMS